MARLSVLVLIPTLLAGYYYFAVATPLYSTQASLLIQQSTTPGAAQGGGLLAGTGFASQPDSVTVQDHLLSAEAMLRLDADHAFRAHFSAPDIDPIQRLDEDASNSDMYRLYKRMVSISYDPTEGLIRMTVLAADPATAVTFANALIGYAEERVDQLNQPIREDQMRGARESYEEAETRVNEAQQRVLDLQEARGVLSADAEINSLMSQISAFEVELRQERLNLQSLLDNPRPNRTRVEVSQSEIARFEALIAEMRSEMTASESGEASLAKITGELVVAQAELETRQTLLAQSLQQLEMARVEANRQVRYLLQGVRPVPSDEPAYPKSGQNTLLAFLIFTGLYLMASLTISILREQVSS
ncbi:MAG: capsule biosynthesis protein [Pseudomonadota bacterium]